MAIIRSKIARQLLAEGGAPRKRFAVGGRDQEDDVAEMMEYQNLHQHLNFQNQLT